MSDALERPHGKLDLFVSFTLLALQGFGGVLAVAQRELVERKRWLTPLQFAEDWAVAQTLPGPNVVNLALMIGGRYFGLGGALSALAGLLLAPVALVLVLAWTVSGLTNQVLVQQVLRGMGAVAAGLIMATGLKMMATFAQNPLGRERCLLFALATFVAVAILRIPLAVVLLVLGTASCVWTWSRLRDKP